MSTRQSVDQAVREFLADKSLPEKRFAALCKLAVQHGGGSSRTTMRAYRVVAWVAVLVVAVLLTLQYQDSVFSGASASIYQRIADEVATNHIKLKPLEVRSSEMSEVRTFFNPLGFALIESSMFENTPWRIMGGRFCTIQGKVAAQLRMRDEEGQVQTLYQALYDADLHRDLPAVIRGEIPMKLYSHGLKIHIWRERSLLFATASEDHVPVGR